MIESFFEYNGERYIIYYEEMNQKIGKYRDGKVVSLEEKDIEILNKIINEKYSYLYDSERLQSLVDSNDKLENKGYLMNFLNWIEASIPEECRDNLYRNIQTLKTELNLDVDLSKPGVIRPGYTTSGGYNTEHNTLTMNAENLKSLWTVAQKTPNPTEFYWKHYAITLLHELLHMASSNYDPETKISKCGFDTYPSKDIIDSNRGLTEGVTEIIAMAGVPQTIEISSGYYIECCLVNQLIILMGPEVIFKSYFSNLGVKPLEEKLNGIINDPTKAFGLFRNIEANYIIKDFDVKQSLLGNIQIALLDYLNKKLENLAAENKTDEIDNILSLYEGILVTIPTLKTMGKNTDNYVGIEESIEKFRGIKEKYLKNAEAL